jgi:NTE family protein
MFLFDAFRSNHRNGVSFKPSRLQQVTAALGTVRESGCLGGCVAAHCKKSFENSSPKIALVFSGGLGLASYHAGAFHAFARSGLALDSVAGSSSGSVAAAIIAGNREDDREVQLRTFWNMPPQPRFEQHPWQHLQGWISAIATHLVGAPGQFHPRLPSFQLFSFRSL